MLMMGADAPATGSEDAGSVSTTVARMELTPFEYANSDAEVQLWPSDPDKVVAIWRMVEPEGSRAKALLVAS
jgi:hypothetical protein